MNPNDAISYLPQVGPEAWAIYCYLVSISNGDCQCSPSYEMIQDATGFARQTIANHLPRLEAAGMITPKRRFSKSTVYTIVAISPYYGLVEPLTTTVKESFKDKSITSLQNGLMESMTFRSDYEEAFYVFAQTTGLLAFNSRTEQADIQRIEAIVKKLGVDGAIEYLKPYYTAWCGRKSQNTGKPYNRTTTGWLDWAIGEQIPSDAKPQQQNQPYDKSERLGI